MTNAQTSADFSRGVSLGGQARDFKLPPSQRSQSLGRSINSIDGRWCGPAADRRPHVTTADQDAGDALGIMPSDAGWVEPGPGGRQSLASSTLSMSWAGSYSDTLY